MWSRIAISLPILSKLSALDTTAHLALASLLFPVHRIHKILSPVSQSAGASLTSLPPR